MLERRIGEDSLAVLKGVVGDAVVCLYGERDSRQRPSWLLSSGVVVKRGVISQATAN